MDWGEGRGYDVGWMCEGGAVRYHTHLRCTTPTLVLNELRYQYSSPSVVPRPSPSIIRPTNQSVYTHTKRSKNNHQDLLAPRQPSRFPASQPCDAVAASRFRSCALIRFDRLARMGIPCFGKLGRASRGGGGGMDWIGLVAVGSGMGE